MRVRVSKFEYVVRTHRMFYNVIIGNSYQWHALLLQFCLIIQACMC